MLIYQDSYQDYYNSDRTFGASVIKNRDSKGVTSQRREKRKVLNKKNSTLLKRLGFTVKKSSKI